MQVDLKDKWRNLLRVAVVCPAAVRGKADKRRELPAELLHKVMHTSLIKALYQAPHWKQRLWVKPRSS